MITGYCKTCGKPCTGHLEEVGIGDYEYMGHRGVDLQKGVFSDCCNGEMCEDERLQVPYDYNEQWKGEEL